MSECIDLVCICTAGLSILDVSVKYKMPVLYLTKQTIAKACLLLALKIDLHFIKDGVDIMSIGLSARSMPFY